MMNLHFFIDGGLIIAVLVMSWEIAQLQKRAKTYNIVLNRMLDNQEFIRDNCPEVKKAVEKHAALDAIIKDLED